MIPRLALRIQTWILGGCGLLLVLLALCWRLTLSSPMQPQQYTDHPCLKVDRSHRDLGSVFPGDKVELQYQLSNNGGGELVVSGLRTPCGCAPATIDTNPIPPGGHATISISFHAPSSAGVTGYSAWFQTNDIDHPDVQLTFQVMARLAIESCPPNVFAGAVIRGGSVSHDFELCSTDGTAFEIKAHRASANWIHVERRAGSTSICHTYRITCTFP